MALPRIKSQPDAALRKRFLAFIEHAGVTLDAECPYPWSHRDLPALKPSDLSTEALDRIVCRLIEAFWSNRAFRAEQRRQALALRAA